MKYYCVWCGKEIPHTSQGGRFYCLDHLEKKGAKYIHEAKLLHRRILADLSSLQETLKRNGVTVSFDKIPTGTLVMMKYWEEVIDPVDKMIQYLEEQDQ